MRTPTLVGDLRRARLAHPGQGPGYRRALADLTDAALAELWAAATADLDVAGVALTAVGSLGRRDGGPLADLDLLLVHDGRVDRARLARLAESLWYPLWDAHLELDHSVRSLEQCRQVASADLPAAVGLLDLRVVAGDADVAETAGRAVLADWRSAARRRLPDLLDSVAARAGRAGELAYLIEPDLKEARGGLRDAVVVRALVASWLTDRPHGDLDRAYRHLLDVRDALARTTGRRSHVLRLAEQDDVATALGLDDDDDVTDPADELLASLAQSARVVTAALDATVRRARRAAEKPRPRVFRPFVVRGRAMPPRLNEPAEGLAEHDGELVLAGGAEPAADPLLALRAAATSARTGLPLSPVTLTSLGASAPIPEPWPAAARDLLVELLGRGEAQVPVWEGLDLAGVVTTWFPEWARVRNRPQRTAVHRHTVDRHMVQTVALVPATTGAVRREDLLLLAAFLHDIGKAPGVRDHAAAGARLAGPMMDRLGLPPGDRDVVVLLVREHLLLPGVAGREDLDDPSVVARVAAAVGHDTDVLTMLRRLTEADAVAAGPQAWTTWRERRVDALTERVRAAVALP